LFDLFSFQRIGADNGWAFAALGIAIDIAGLAILALVVSRVPKLVALLEKVGGLLRKAPAQQRRKAGAKPKPDNLSEEGIHDIAAVYKAYAGSGGEVFQLSELYRASEESGQPHPHLTIKTLRESGLLISQGNGLFTWRN
jgi:hypothetical protein